MIAAIRFRVLGAGVLFCMTLMSSMCLEAGTVIPDVASRAATQIEANADGDALGRSVSFVGDINGDGRPDMLVGASSDGGSSLGSRAFVVFGTAAGGLPTTINVTQLDGSSGFTLSMAQTGTRLGYSVAALGDINNDGRADFAIGAPFADAGMSPAIRHDAGKVFVVFGRASSNPFPSQLNLDNLNGSDGFVIEGAQADDRLGHSVASAGDFNGDGLPDLIAGSVNAIAGAANSAWIILGRATAFPAIVTTGSLAAGAQGFELDADAGQDFSSAVAGVGDMDGDGKDEVAIGAPAAVTSNSNAGRVYVLHGRAVSAVPAENVLNLDAPATPAVQKLDGEGPGYFVGASLAGLGDINGDGIPDFIAGMPGRGGYVGGAWIVFGSSSLPSDTLNAMNGRGEAVNVLDYGGSHNANIGTAVAGGQDFDGDGINDIVLAAPGGYLRSGETRNGAVYVIPGRDAGTPWPAIFDLFSLPTGLRLDGVTDVGPANAAPLFNVPAMSVALGPDSNGDGAVDLLIGSPLGQASTSDTTLGPWQGRAWLVSSDAVSDTIFADGFEVP